MTRIAAERAAEISARLKDIEDAREHCTLHSRDPDGAADPFASEIRYESYRRPSALPGALGASYLGFGQMISGVPTVATHFGIVRDGRLVFSGRLYPSVPIDIGVEPQIGYPRLRDHVDPGPLVEYDLLQTELKLCTMIDGQDLHDRLVTAERLMLYFGSVFREVVNLSREGPYR